MSPDIVNLKKDYYSLGDMMKHVVTKILDLLKNPTLLNSKKTNSLPWLNLTQFFGVINDNLYKLLLVFLFIDLLGNEQASTILSAAGAVYVVPFLLFSSSAGILADKFSKQKLIVILKSFEVVIMSFALWAFYCKSLYNSYILLFLLASHSALFGPSKYGIIPEIVSKEKITKSASLIL